MIFTTNKSLKGWGRVLHDEDLAQAIIDRVLERGRLLRLDGPSVRTLHVNLDEAMKEDSDQAGGLDQNFRKDLSRISGTHNGFANSEWTASSTDRMAPPAAIFHHGRLGLSFGNSRSAKRNSNPSPVTLRRI